MVWGAIAYDSRSSLVRIQGTMKAQRYLDNVLQSVAIPYLQGLPNANFQQDNARPHSARICQHALRCIQMLPWLPYFPDLSAIEYVWDVIGRRLQTLPLPRSEDELWQMVEKEWRAIPQDAIRSLIDSMPRRVSSCIVVRGAPTMNVLASLDKGGRGAILINHNGCEINLVDVKVRYHKICA
ncbi:Transposable element Tcb1 transposase, partial [Stegodyphus mimosarum]